MKRRTFLQRAGLAAGGGWSVLAADGRTARAAPGTEAGESAAKGAKPVLVTSAANNLARAITAGLSDTRPVRLTARAEVHSQYEFFRCPLERDALTAALVHDVGAVVLVDEPRGGASLEDQIDYRTRCTYNLLLAAAQKGLGPVVYLSFLEMMTAYDAEYDVTEDWRPRPSPQSAALADYLGECVAREFAHERKLHVIVLRLGKVVRAEAVQGQPFDPLWVDQRDVVQAVSLALAAEPGPADSAAAWWSVFHILSASPAARFSIEKARRDLGYKPQFNG